MKIETKNEYLSLANHFIEKHIGEPEDVTPQKLINALLSCASDYRPPYWRRLRRALAVHQEDAGYKPSANKISKIKNPMTAKNADKSLIKPKEKRVKRIIADDEKKLLNHFKSKKDFASMGAIYLAKYLGVRPAEMDVITFIEPCKVFINGAKKDEKGIRGLDRTLLLDKSIIELIKKSLRVIQDVPVGKLQDRIYEGSKACFPRRKARPSLYTWRHQMGSNLKASKIDRVEMAYVMGHQSTKSLNVYGNKKTSNGGLKVSAYADKNFELIREKHIENNEISQKVKKAKSIKNRQINKKPQLQNQGFDFER